jgi:CAAX prenyl protease-like protein
MILAAAMLSRAASGSFEWLYPLRLLAAGAALWYYRSSYGQLNWRFGWFSPVAGILVFALWLALDRLAGPHSDTVIANGLAAAAPSARIVWLILRTAAAVITVPIAEELAFRGFLMRRLISADFESVGLQEFTYVSVVVSSVAFGLMHGDRWLAGTAAGLIYAGALLRRGRIGDAVVAHATTNGLLAAWVLIGGHWNMW